MKTSTYIFSVILAIFVIMGYVQNTRYQELKVAYNLKSQELMQIEAARIEEADQYMALNERFNACEDKYAATYGQKARVFFAKINPFDKE